MTIASGDTPSASTTRPSTSARRKLVVLALDAAEPTLLRAWAADGTLPNIRALMDDGVVATVRSVETLYVGATWPSFYTAVNPARHGIYWLDRLVPGRYRVRRTSAAEFARTRTLWDVLGDAGRRVVVLDVPLSRCTRGLNGVQVVEWGVHDAAFGLSTEPASLARELVHEFGAHPAPPACDRDHRTAAEYREFADQLVRGAHQRARLTTSLLERTPWDFALQVFSEAHCAGHQLWHFHDPAHPAFASARADGAPDLVREVYVAIDAAVGDIVRTLDDHTAVVVMSLHGMSWLSGAAPLFTEILTRLGVMTPLSARGGVAAADQAAPRAGDAAEPLPSPARRSSFARRGVHAVLGGARRLWHRLPVSWRTPLYHARQHVNTRWLDRGTPIEIDPLRSQCFPCDLGPAVSGVRINLAGREADGIVAPDAVDAFCAQLTRELMALVDPASNRPLARRVIRTADHFTGDRLHELPDLLVEWDLDRPLGTTATGSGTDAMLRAFSPRVGLIEQVNSYCRTGEHRIHGLLVARGPGIVPAALTREIPSLDLAPTFARLLGCDMADVDGHVIEELLPVLLDGDRASAAPRA